MQFSAASRWEEVRNPTKRIFRQSIDDLAKSIDWASAAFDWLIQ